MRVNVGIDALRLALPCVSREERRYYLDGFWVEPAEVGVLVVATDGCMVAVMHDPEGFIDRGAILKANRGALKRVKRGGRLIADLPDAPGAKASVGAIERDDEIVAGLAVREIDGTYPNWRKVIPIKPGLVSSWKHGFDAYRLGALARAVRAVFPGPVEMVTIRQQVEDGPAVVRFGVVRDGFYILMPMRADGSPSSPFPIPADVLRLPEDPASEAAS